MKFPFFASFIVFIIWLGYEIKKSQSQGEKSESEFWEKEARAGSIRKKSLDNLPYVVFDFSSLPDAAIFQDLLVGSSSLEMSTTSQTDLTSTETIADNNTSSESWDNTDTVASSVSADNTDTVASSENGQDTQENYFQIALAALSELNNLRGKKIVNLNGITNTDLKLTYGTANITPLSEYDDNYAVFAKNIPLVARGLYHLGKTQEAKALLEKTIGTGTDVTLHYTLLARIYKQEGEAEKIEDLKEMAKGLSSLIKNTILRALDQI